MRVEMEDLIKDGAREGIPPDKLRWSQRGGLCSCRMKGAE